MTGNLKFLTNFVEKFLGKVKFGNNEIAPILGYGDLVQFCDAHLEVAFWKSTCYIPDLEGTMISHEDHVAQNYACLWHRRLSLLNFDTINLLSMYDIDTCPPLPKLKFVIRASLFSWYSTPSRAYQMASDHISSDPISQCPTTALKHDSLSPGPQSQEHVPQADETVTMSNELDLLFSPMFDELLNETTQVISKSSAVTTTDAPNQRQ
ncbi:hypothetical protein Tco_1478753 [Tanacetum coccineum]